MPFSRAEVQERWLVGALVDVDVDALTASLNRVEEDFGRAWLDAELASGTAVQNGVLSAHLIGNNLKIIEGTPRAEQLRRRVRAREEAAQSELLALALCASEQSVQVEIEPPIVVDRRNRVPDFRLRKGQEPWVHVEVTAPTDTESKVVAQAAAARLSQSLQLVPDGVIVEIRFRDEPTDADLEEVAGELTEAKIGRIVDRSRFVLHAAKAAEGVSTGPDELGRPVVGCLSARMDGKDSALVAVNEPGGLRARIEAEQGALIAVRVPFLDDRARSIIDAEAQQIPKEGPGLICVRTPYGQWRGLIERSFSPTIRRRISGVLMFTTGIRLGARGNSLKTIGRLILNPYARTPLPAWLQDRLGSLPGAF
jgi:hypothetical protein